MIHWEKKVLDYVPPSDGKFSKILVPTVDTVRFSFLLGLCIDIKRPCMFVGDSGTSKSIIIQNYLNEMSPESYMKLTVNFSSRTSGGDISNIIEDNIDKRTGRIFGPKMPGKKLLCFVDDIHMPKIDTYGT